MSEQQRPPKPRPDCVWDAEAGVWKWPGDCDERQRKADELAAEPGESGAWEQHGFRRKHTARVDKR
ncbi:unnamed protein product [marine sediment metagenome]|uniref:Uncharacterized protein n=1 Tax=marine sediment metagenome TaxID=412755 RepID=X0Y4G5_9ZZZZ